jgi:A/G-specific adenine glycosylase
VAATFEDKRKFPRSERIARKELGLEIGVGSPLAAVKHAYSHFRITLTAFSCTLREGIPAGSPWQWAGTGELEELPFSKADRLIARSIAPATGH